MINIAYDISQREGYSLQPTKSVILPVKTSNTISHEDETWTMNNNSMPIVDQTARIGIQRHFKIPAQHLMDPMFAPTPAQSKISSN
jgi:hypothetical protein